MKQIPTSSNTKDIALTDDEFIIGLKKNDKRIVHLFFYEICNYILNDIRISVFQGKLEYDELVNELFLYLSEKDWHKLDTFQGFNGCHLKSWMIRLCWRFFLQRREALLGLPADQNIDICAIQSEKSDDFNIEISMDVESTFANMPNEKYVMVLRMLLKEGYSPEEVAKTLQTTTSNVYNLKHRAILQFISTYCGHL